jgi:hypothetical protein
VGRVFDDLQNARTAEAQQRLGIGVFPLRCAIDSGSPIAAAFLS